MRIKNQLGAILFWSVISAAFIGPGTVTTSASAGAGYGINLIWVLVLSTFVCIVLQVNVTRLTIESGITIGELMITYLSKHLYIPIALGISIVFGCAAYQAGNLLGAALGVSIIFKVDQKWILLLIVLLASTMLWFGSIKIVVRILGLVVALMGIVFIVIGFSIDFSLSEIIHKSFTPNIPMGSEILVMGLIGTTIVPYNLFLGSGLSKGQKLSTSTFGLILAITVGGMISIAILLVGTLVMEPFSFEKLSAELVYKLGRWANLLLGIGLFSAGFTSSMTAPIAAVFTMQSIFPGIAKLKSQDSKSYRAIWMFVMLTGLIFGFLNINPIPAIILAQAVNGIILPFVAVFILFVVASRTKMEGNKGAFSTVLLSLVVSLIVSIGAFNLLKLFFHPGTALILFAVVVGILVTGLFVGRARFISNKTS